MSILILEALGAGALLIFIVWWTMFSGRKGGELSAPPQDRAEPIPPGAGSPAAPIEDATPPAAPKP